MPEQNPAIGQPSPSINLLTPQSSVSLTDEPEKEEESNSQKIIVLIFLIVFLLLGAGILFVSWIKNPEENSQDEVAASATPAVSTEIEPTETITGDIDEEQSSGMLQFQVAIKGVYSAEGDPKYSFTGEMPLSAVISNSTESSFMIEDKMFVFKVRELGEGELKEYLAIDQTRESSTLGAFIRVILSDTPDIYNYVSVEESFKLSGSCTYLGRELVAPCGSGSILRTWGSLEVTCIELETGGVEKCDQIMSSINVAPLSN